MSDEVKYQVNFIFEDEKQYEKYKQLIDENVRLIGQMITYKKICTWKGEKEWAAV